MGTKGLRYAIRDGFSSLRRNPLIMLASITTMFLMLCMISAFFLFSANVSHLIHVAAEQPPIEVMFRVDSNPGNVETLAQVLEKNSNVAYHRIMTPQENFEHFKEKIGKKELFDSFDFANHIPYSIQVRLKDPALAATFQKEVSHYPGVREVLMESRVMELLQKAVRWVSILSLLIFGVLLLITIFIISNMIRVAALSRSVEINIMKYVGATNRYIRIPFVIEGLFVGFVSAFLASLATSFLYRMLIDRFGFHPAAEMKLALLPSWEVLPMDVLALILFGLIIGGITTGLSVRKYVRV